MANSDSAQYVLRFNEITGNLETQIGLNWVALNLSGVSGITQLTGDVTAGPGSGSQAATVVSVGGETASAIATAVAQAGAALPSASFTSAAVTGKLLTGYVSGAGTVASTDTILEGIDKLNGNAVITDTNQKANIPGASTPAGTGTVTPVATATSLFTFTVSGALTINGPSSPTDGQKIMLRVINDASHSVTLATGSGNFRFGTDITAYTNTVSLTDYIGAVYNSAATRWDVVSLVQGF